MGSPEEGELVETGTFRIDSERMLAVLSRYQFQSPDMFLRAWIRCAVASGAAEVTLDRASGGPGPGFELSFDGKPFTREELSDLYAPLFAGGFSRGRHFAAGLLALFRTNPVLITISSGGESVNLTGMLEHTPGPATQGTRTILRAFWTAEPKELPVDRILSYPAEADEAMVCCPIPVRSACAASKTFSRLADTSLSLVFKESGRYGFISPLTPAFPMPVTEPPPAANSEVDIYVLGVYVETYIAQMPLVPVSADINDDSLTLDASFGKCVRDEKFSEMLAFLEKQAEALLLREIAVHKRDLAEVGGQMRNKKYVGLWRGCLGYMEDWQTAVSSSTFMAALSALVNCLNRPQQRRTESEVPAEGHRYYGIASRTIWLQDACRRAFKKNTALPPDAPALRALWTAPVLLSIRGGMLSLAAIRNRVIKGGLAVSKCALSEIYSKNDAVWLASLRDENFLGYWIPRGNWTGNRY
ncbi:MAG: hypothetical protein Q7R35_12125 [Elusimicrobiota bacterium]|nr:hypothetical protein [Elusimicrobiota bacterium]